MPNVTLLDSIAQGDNSYQWMRTLINAGAWAANADSRHPVTVAVCLPRVEFAGLLVASGACLQVAQSPVPEDWRERLGELVGQRIAYSLRGRNSYVYWEGILCEPDPSDSTNVRIQATSEGHVDRWPLDDLFSVQLDPAKAGQSLEAHVQSKKAFRDERSIRLRALLTDCAVGRLCGWWHQLTLVGVKKRIFGELNELLPDSSKSSADCTFADLLRPEGYVADSVITRLLSAKDLTGDSACGIVIIEGSRRLSEHLTATQQRNRIVLLGRNEPHYSDCAEIVTSHFQQRRSDVAWTDFECPEHMKMKIFHH
jgi:hypothetical protein